MKSLQAPEQIASPTVGNAKHRLASLSSLIGLSAGALGWSSLASANDEGRDLQTLILPDTYSALDDGTVILQLETGEQLTLTADQYVMLDGGLLLVVDELAQNSVAELPVLGSLRTQLFTEVQPVRSPDGTIVEATNQQPLWSGEGPAPRLFEEIDIQRFEIAQDQQEEDEDDEGLFLGGALAGIGITTLGIMNTGAADDDGDESTDGGGSDGGGSDGGDLGGVDCDREREPVLYDIYPGSSSGNPGNRVVEVDGKVYFKASNAEITNGIFEFDINTKSVTGIDIWPGSNSAAEVMGAYDGTVYIRARDNFNTSDTQYALWTYNANDGLNKVDTTAIRENIDPKKDFFIEYGGVIYFAGKDLVSDGAGGFSTSSSVPRELMSYDPSTGTVSVLTDFESLNGTFTSDGINATGAPPALVGDDIYFYANSSGNVASQQGGYYGIYKYNIPTDTLTEMDFDDNIVTATSNVPYIFEFDDKLWLALDPDARNVSGTYDLYSYTGTGSTLVKETDIGAGAINSLNHWFELGGNLYFANRDDWTWYKVEPGSAPLTYSVENAFSGFTSFGPGWPPVSDCGVYFAANDGTFGQELWLWDGTSTSPERLTDIDDSGNGVSWVTFVASDDSVFLNGNDGLGAGSELWVYG